MKIFDILTIDELVKFKETEKVLYAKNGKKALYIDLNGNNIIQVDGETIYTTIQVKDAIDFYNGITGIVELLWCDFVRNKSK